MREILFRGKRNKDGKWLYGDLLIHKSCKGIYGINLLNENGRVIYKTVGQYTGLKDKNGVKIFEGDIIKVKSYDYDYNYITKVKAYGATMCVDVIGQDWDNTSIDFANDIWDDENAKVEVIGNIYDNPELLEVEE